MDFILKEKTEQLCDVLVPHIYTGFTDLYKNAKKLNDDMGRPSSKVLMTFQLCLKRVPHLSTHQLEKDYRILEDKLAKQDHTSGWLRGLLVDIFTVYAKCHLAKEVKITEQDLNIPDNVNFIHKCYIESARLFWLEPNLFADYYKPLDVQKNQVFARGKIKEAIYKTIRNLIPFEKLTNIHKVEYSEQSTCIDIESTETSESTTEEDVKTISVDKKIKDIPKIEIDFIEELDDYHTANDFDVPANKGEDTYSNILTELG
jgi:hypothetical protein